MKHAEAELHYHPRRREYEITLWYLGRDGQPFDWIGICGRTLVDCISETAIFCKRQGILIVKAETAS